MNLIGEQRELAKGLSLTEQAIIVASRADKISIIENEQVSLAVFDLVSKAYFTIGHTATKEDKFILCQQLVSDLKNKFHNFTLEEVKSAMYLGSRGEFKTKPDEVLFISIEKIYSWLKAYRETIRKEAVGKQLRYEQDNPIKFEPSDDFASRFNVLGVRNSLLDKYKEFPNDSLAGNIYRVLDKIGVITLTVKRKKEFWAEAEAELKVKYKAKGNTIDEWHKNKTMLELITSGSTEGQSEVKILAIRKALDSFLEACEEMGEDVKLLIDEKFK